MPMYLRTSLRMVMIRKLASGTREQLNQLFWFLIDFCTNKLFKLLTTCTTTFEIFLKLWHRYNAVFVTCKSMSLLRYFAWHNYSILHYYSIHWLTLTGMLVLPLCFCTVCCLYTHSNYCKILVHSLHKNLLDLGCIMIITIATNLWMFDQNASYYA